MKLDFTGRASLIVEMKNSGPMIVDINDDVLLAILIGNLLDASGDFPVSGYKKKTKKHAKKLLARK